MRDRMRMALEQMLGEDFDQLEPETQAAIEDGEAQYHKGEGMPLDEAFALLRERHAS